MDPGRVSPRYPLRNADDAEAARLAQLQALSDPFTIEALQALGVGPGWHCAELGAGAGSMVRWMAGRVGPEGSVAAVDRDATRLHALGGEHPNVVVVEADLCSLELPRADYDLVHTRWVLMHLDRPEETVRRAVSALRPGGIGYFEESDGSPALALEDAPEPFRRVMVPIAARWTSAPRLAPLLESLGMVEVHDDVSQEDLVGGGPRAEFWRHTLASVRRLSNRAAAAGTARRHGLEPEWVDAMAALLEDPGTCLPFAARHRVVARKP